MGATAVVELDQVRHVGIPQTMQIELVGQTGVDIIIERDVPGYLGCRRRWFLLKPIQPQRLVSVASPIQPLFLIQFITALMSTVPEFVLLVRMNENT
jgi:hypothetical protein